MSNSVVITLAAVGLAIVDVATYVGTGMTNVRLLLDIILFVGMHIKTT